MSDITRSEAIKQLRILKADINNGLAFVSKTKDKHKALESLDMAITSLETDEAYNLMYEQPEFCEDAISRNAVMDMIIEYRDSLTDTGKKDALERAYGANYVGMKIADMPSVLPKADKPSGKWIEKEHFVGCSGSAECSVCHERTSVNPHDNGFSLEYIFPKYCPNCGAMMESEDDK